MHLIAIAEVCIISDEIAIADLCNISDDNGVANEPVLEPLVFFFLYCNHFSLCQLAVRLLLKAKVKANEVRSFLLRS